MQMNPDVRAFSQPDKPGYNEEELTNLLKSTPYDSNEAGSYVRNATNRWSAYLDQLSPSQLAARYKHYADQGINDLASYTQQKYGFGNAKDAAYYTAYKSAKDMLGRDLEANEFAQLAPMFYNPADFGSGIATGRQALAAFAEQESKSPAKLGLKAPEHYGTVDKTVQDFLKRSATPEEQAHFGKLLASGELDPYELQGFIKSQPEYQAGQDKAFREGLNTELASYDTDFFNKAKEDVISRFARNQPGASISSNPSLDYALTELMGNISKERSKYLAGVSAEQYGGNKAAAREDYRTNLDRMFGEQDYTRGRADTLSDYYRNRSDAAYDYATQRNDYLSALEKMQPRRDNRFSARDWINLGFGAVNTGANAYSAFSPSKGSQFFD